MTTRNGSSIRWLVVLALAGCSSSEKSGANGGSGGGSGNPGGRGGSGGSGEQVQLKMTWWGSPDRAMRTQQVIEMFQAKNPDIKISSEYWQPTQEGGVGKAYWPTLLKYQADGTLPDIMQHDYAYIEEWTKRGDLRALDDYLADKTLDLGDVPQPLIDGGKVGDKLMGVSLGLNTQVIAVDTDLFAKHSIALPTDEWTWEDFERIVLEIKTKTGSWGAGGGLHNYTPGWKAVYLSSRQWVFSPDGKSLGYTDDTPWVKHFDMLLRLQDKGAIPQLHEEPKGGNINTDLIVTGKSGLTWLFSNQLVALTNAANMASGGVERNFKLYPLPRVKDGISPVYLKPSQYFSVTATSKHPQQAARVIQFFTNDIEANKILAGERGVPVNSKVLEALKPTLSKPAAESFALIERATKYAQSTPPNDPPGWTTILTQILEPRTIPGIMYKSWTSVEGTANFRKDANLVLMGGMVPDGGAPDLPPVPEAGADGGVAADAGPETGARDTQPTSAMSFFVTSTGSGAMGGNLGGLAGADAKCEMLAAAAGAGGRGWKAYLSAEATGGSPAVNAKDRIGAGPWRNQRGQMVAASVTALLAGFAANLVVDEKGAPVPGNQHDILTGSNVDGTVYAGRTCGSWTSTMGQSQVGHSDGAVGGRLSAHASGCTEAGIRATAGSGRTYCFATTP